MEHNSTDTTITDEQRQAEQHNQARSPKSESLVESEYLTKIDLVKLIEEDSMVKQAVCRLMSQVFDCGAQFKQEGKLKKIEQVQSGETIETGKGQLEEKGIQTLLLELVRAEKNILTSWLNKDDDELLAQARVVAFAADFDRILTAWDAFAKHCRQNQQPLSESQQELLSIIVKVFNLTTAQQQASLVFAEVGQKYDYEQHNNIGADGKRINQLLMPGIQNVAGRLIKKPVVLVE